MISYLQNDKQDIRNKEQSEWLEKNLKNLSLLEAVKVKIKDFLNECDEQKDK